METLLEALCRVNGQQGGTIHQFAEGANPHDWIAMKLAYVDFARMGIEFPSRAAFDKLAAQYHVRINWE